VTDDPTEDRSQYDESKDYRDEVEVVCAECKKPYMQRVHMSELIASHNCDEAAARAAVKAVWWGNCEDCLIWMEALARRKQERKKNV
jgi:hypothetical protein